VLAIKASGRVRDAATVFEAHFVFADFPFHPLFDVW